MLVIGKIKDLSCSEYRFTGGSLEDAANPANNPSPRLQAGDWVKIRSLKEIEATLNHWGGQGLCLYARNGRILRFDPAGS
jgi:hypothetical protein